MLEGCTPWPEEYAARYRAEGWWQDIRLAEMLRRSAQRRPDHIAVIDGERSATYAQLVEASDRLAVQFAKLGLRPLDRVIFQLANSLELVHAFFALTRVGAIPVMALPAHRLHEIRHFAQHAGAVGYLIPERGDFDYAAMAEEARRELPALQLVISAGGQRAGHHGHHALSDLLAAPVGDDELESFRRTAPDDAQEVALMLLSGGTTALPKLIPRTHNDYVYNCMQSGQVAGFGPDTVYLAVLPMAHNYTLASPGILAALALGGTVVVSRDVRAESVFPAIERHRVTVVAGGVPLAASWLQTSWPERCDLSSLKVYMNGGAKLVPELRRQIEHRFGCVYVESFGTGEGLLNQTRLDDPEAIRYQSSGRPVSPGDEIRIVDGNGNEVPDGVVGELTVRGPYTIRGYYRAAEVSAAAFTRDGYYRMGDAVRRVDGYLYVEGRLKDLINRGGEKISSEEIENHIIAHPAVQNVCVVAMPDPIHGEKACAFVILTPDATLDLEALKAFLLRRNIAKFKLPERLEIVDSFPISPAGKVLRRELRARIAAVIVSESAEAMPGRVA